MDFTFTSCILQKFAAKKSISFPSSQLVRVICLLKLYEEHCEESHRPLAKMDNFVKLVKWPKAINKSGSF